MSFHENVLVSIPISNDGVAEIRNVSIQTDAGMVFITQDLYLFLVHPFELVFRVEDNKLMMVARKRARRIWELKMEAEKNG